jgi:midasin
LVQAVRKGWWIVLDELNLAPSDVLEALNRLLDDNRELFVPELQETIRPHPHFALFATQNPPGVTYGGRKTLSKAFRNRFMELHVGDIPDDELRIILNKRCSVAPSYAAKIVEVMRELQRRRRASRAFAGKDGFVTARDLFRWANRGAASYEELARDGFKTLGERLRSDEERDALKETLVKILKVDNKREETLAFSVLYASAEEASLTQRLTEAATRALATADCAERDARKNKNAKKGGPKKDTLAEVSARVARRDAADASALSSAMAWTPAARRLFSLVESCLEHSEPALLVGETGCGKTSVCQLLALLRGQKLRILNCHQHTETGDFLGGFRPARKESDAEDATKDSVPFAWEDGPLVQAMRDGDILLVDEMSLAEDSVLERLNSVLEQGRALTLPEKGGSEVEELVAHKNFRVLATMNPGGDFGKKELSPALRNRFCEIWIGASSDEAEMAQIVQRRIPEAPLSDYSSKLAQFWSFYREAAGKGAARSALLTRDLVAWAQFMRAANDPSGEGSAASGCSRRLSPEEAYAHGAYLTLLDGLGLGAGSARGNRQASRRRVPRVSAEAVAEEGAFRLEVGFFFFFLNPGFSPRPRVRARR